MPFDKIHILREIKRLASANGGRAPGRSAFERKTGVRVADWYPHIWLRWNEAIAEVECSPNQLQSKIPDDVLIEKYIALTRELGRIPVAGELRRKARSDNSFPSHTTFKRFGGKDKLIDAVSEYCRRHSQYPDILSLIDSLVRPSTPAGRETEGKVVTGFVYLMKSARHYKIGRSNSVGRRESELGIKIPVPPKTIHYIETDDPLGVEAYWHRRFADKRGEGEWFNLSPADVKAFKRWKRIV
jgi:hypothetical protein